MRKLLRVLGWIVFLCVLLIAFAIVYSTAKGNVEWYFRVNGVVTVNGQKSAGYLHANTKRTFLFLTRTDEVRPETYLIPVREARGVTDCGDWYPPRFLPFPMGGGDMPPCAPFPDPAKVMDAAVDSTLITSRRSVEFSTVSGRKIKAEW